MRIQETAIKGVLQIEPRVYEDGRGYFYEGFNLKLLERLVGSASFVQENVSGSRRGVVRGLHYQLEPEAQGKLVHIAQGEVFDVVVDLRRGSPSFGRWVSTVLSDHNRIRLWVPPGFAHGFCALSDFAQFVYAVTKPYSPEHERTLLWNDPELSIPWPHLECEYLLSEKDRHGRPLRQAEINSEYDKSS
jgi:dTDP-4-dehydrorhamnose 3,5-epimerase